MTPTKPAGARKATKKATKKAATTSTTRTSSTSTTSPDTYSVRVGAVVEHRFHDVLTDTDVTETGIVVKITGDGAYVAPLSAAAVVPLDRLRAV